MATLGIYIHFHCVAPILPDLHNGKLRLILRVALLIINILISHVAISDNPFVHYFIYFRNLLPQMNPLVNQGLSESFEAAGPKGRVIIDIDLGGNSRALRALKRY